MTLLRYLFVGGTAAAVDFLLFGLLIFVGNIPWAYAAIGSFILATLVNYLLSIRFVFDSGVRFNKSAEIGLVFLVSAGGLAINQSAMWLMIEKLGIHPILAKPVATLTVFVWNYAIRLTWIFKPRNE